MKTWAGRLAGQVSAWAALAVAAQAATAAESVVLTPHRAVYDIALDKARSAAGMNGLVGRMVYELTGSPCEGYTQTMRYVTRMSSDSGSVTLSDLRSSSFEDQGGDKFRFSSSQYKDEELSEQVSGDATRSNGGITVELQRPAKSELKLKGKPLFPVQHSVALIEAARSGKTLFTADLFDGSEKAEKVFSTTAAIGRELKPGFNATLPQVKNAEMLDRMRAWPVSLSYFEQGKDKQDAVPTYELAFVFYENGVSRRLFIDYGEFSIKGQLKEFTFLEAAKCDKK